jgi:cell pole-organizing protein PopZ
MSQSETANEPSMEEILASIRSIISDDGQQDSPDAQDHSATDNADEAVDEASLDALFESSSDPSDESAGTEDEDAGNSQDDIDALFGPDVDEAEDDGDSPGDAENDILELSEDDLDFEEEDSELIEPINDLEFTDGQSEKADAEDFSQNFEEDSADEEMAAHAPEPPVEPRPNLSSDSLSSEAMNGLLSPHANQMVSSAFGDLANTILANNARTLDDLVQDMLRPMLKAWLDDNLPPLVERLVRAEIERVSRGGPRKPQ